MLKAACKLMQFNQCCEVKVQYLSILLTLLKAEVCKGGAGLYPGGHENNSALPITTFANCSFILESTNIKL